MTANVELIDDDELDHATKAKKLYEVLVWKIDELEAEGKTLADIAEEDPRWFLEYCLGWLLEQELADEENNTVQAISTC